METTEKLMVECPTCLQAVTPIPVPYIDENDDTADNLIVPKVKWVENTPELEYEFDSQRLAEHLKYTYKCPFCKDTMFYEVSEVIKAAMKYRRKTLTMQTIFKVCDNLGITKIGVGMRDDTFKDSVKWPFATYHSIFVDGRDSLGTWPVAWQVAEEVEREMHKTFPDVPKDEHMFSNGCGNSGQHQIVGSTIVPGIYKKDKSKGWLKCDTK